MELETMDRLFEYELRDLYSAETQVMKALPAMVNAASSPALRSTLQEHLVVTEQQLERLHGAMRQLNIEPDSLLCIGMAGLIEETNQLVRSQGDPSVKDAALIGAAQRVEHYEIAAYGTVREFARDLGHDDIARSLDTTLHEEGDADKELSRIARGTYFETGINAVALG